LELGIFTLKAGLKAKRVMGAWNLHFEFRALAGSPLNACSMVMAGGYLE